MKKYIKTDYQDCTLWNAEDLFRYLDELIGNISASQNLENQDHVAMILTTAQFDSAVKSLSKDNRRVEIQRLKDVIAELSDLSITKQNRNHGIGGNHNKDGVCDIHISGDLVLLYRYVTDSMLVVSLKLSNIIDHKEFRKNIVKKHENIKREISYEDREHVVDDITNRRNKS